AGDHPPRPHPGPDRRGRPPLPPPGRAGPQARGGRSHRHPERPAPHGSPRAGLGAGTRCRHPPPLSRARPLAAAGPRRRSRPMTAPRLGIGVIGAGRVGAVLAAALRSEGHAITGAYAVSDASVARAEQLLPGVPLLEVADIIERSEMLLLAVPDDQLGPLVAGIAATGLSPGGQLVVHTSGRYGTDVLAPLAAVGSATLAIHPAMTFTGTRDDLARLVGCPMAITADPTFLPVAAALVVERRGESVVLPEGDRPLYHAALAHGANHLVVLVDQTLEALSRLGIEDPGAYLRPLLEAALEESLRRGAKALTGPV